MLKQVYSRLSIDTVEGSNHVDEASWEWRLAEG